MRELKAIIVLLMMTTVNLTVRGAESSRAISFQGQQFEEVTLEQILTETRYRDEQYEDTCYRDEPYTDNVCEQVVVGHDRQCRTIPGYEDCHNVPDRVCRTVTRTRRECTPGPSRRVCRRGPDRQECSRGPSRQQCSTGPSRQVCSNGPSRQVCTTGSSRQVCENVRENVCRDVNGRRVCRDVTRRQCRNVPGERTCQTVPGERTCRTVPGERTCQTIPGERTCRTIPGDNICTNEPGAPICRDVPYADQECHTVNRRICNWIPAREECRDVPVYDTVCRDVTRTRQVPYACTRTRQVPYEHKIKDIRADLKIAFDDTLHPSKARFTVALDKKGKITLEAQDLSLSPALITATRKLDANDSDELLQIDGSFDVTFRNRNMLNPVSADPEKLKLRKKKISFLLPRVEQEGDLAIKAVIKDKKQKVVYEKLFEGEGLSLRPKDGKTEVTIDLEKAKLKWLHKYKIILDVRIMFQGKVLNTPAPVTKRVVDLSKVRWL